MKLKPLSLLIVSAFTLTPLAQATTLLPPGETQDVNSGEVVSDILIDNTATLNVNDGGTSNNSSIYSGGVENVHDGGHAEGTTIQFGGTQNVYGTANNTTVEHGGAQYVNGGGSATGTIIEGGTGGDNASQHVTANATTTGTIIKGGTQYVYEDGYAEGTSINSGSQVIYAGGTASGSILVNGTQSVFGTANYTEMSGGTLLVNDGGESNNAIMNGGNISVNVGGTSNDTVGYAGYHTIRGESNNSVMNESAYEIISVGGVANNSELNGNSTQDVNGVANNTTINDSALQIVLQGTTDGTVINSGEQRLRYNSTVTNTSIEGENALQNITSGSTSIDTTVNAGNQWVYGTTTDTTINGGLSTLFNGGLADGKTEINAGGEMLMHAGSQATDVTINNGTLTVNSITESTSADVAEIGALTMKGGTVAFQAGESDHYASLNIGDLSGTGTFLFNTSLADQASNFITIAQGSGSFGVAVSDSGKEIADHDDLTVNLINDQGGDIDFALQSTRGGSTRAVDGGAYMYVLKQETGKDGMDGNVWYLGAMTDEEGGDGDNGSSGGNNGGGNLVTTPSTDAILSLANAGLNIMRGEMEGLRAARQGNSTGLQHGEGSVWGHYLGKKSSAETSNGAAYKLYQNGMELGGDVVSDLGNSQLVTGGFVSLTGNNVKHARGGTSSVDSYGLGAYATWYDNSGLYLDGTLKANRLESQLSARMTNGDMTSGKWHQYGLSAALEAGYTFTPMDSMTVEPFVRMTGTTINDANVKLNNGMTAKTGKARSLTAEAGSRVATDVSLGNFALRPYLSISVEQELAHSNETIINEVNRFKNHQNGTSGKYGAGITVSPAKDVTLYGELNYRQGSYVEEPVQGMAGIRISF